MGGFPFLHTFSSIYCLSTFWWWPFWLAWGDILLLFWYALLWRLVILSIFSYPLWPFARCLWRKVYSGFLSMGSLCWKGDRLSCRQGSRALVGHGISLSLVLCLYLVYIMLIIWQLVESYKLFPVSFWVFMFSWASSQIFLWDIGEGLFRGCLPDTILNQS